MNSATTPGNRFATEIWAGRLAQPVRIGDEADSDFRVAGRASQATTGTGIDGGMLEDGDCALFTDPSTPQP
ncbi:MAG TPA: hypothetical protein VNO52_10430 [Methylomirabilota bacterium]|nr:hypothetical protein [Methylomirabilota bacterium]